MSRHETQCSVEGCEAPVLVRSRILCRRHNYRFLRYGDPVAPSAHVWDRPLAQRLLEKVTINADGCWVWTGSMRHRYGEMIIGGRRRYPHRISFEQFVRPLAPGEVVCHRCDNPPCINPGHLFAGSQRDNSLDMIAKGRGGGQFVRRPIRHGSRSGAAVHRRRGEKPCDECREARNAWQRLYRQSRAS